MQPSRFAGPAIIAAAALGLLACHEHSDTTTAPGAIANVFVDAPASARSGESFDVTIRVTNVGVNNIHNARVNVTLASPLTVGSLDASSGTSATFSNGAAVSTVNWTLNTLDSNSQSSLHINTRGVLPPGEASRTVRVEGSLTADRISPGDAVAHADVQLTL
ncbi:MAG TPA: hypothetical protein VGL03_15335 [Thermoanaerobaculia bacterium]|jgi:hypothetical protein